MAEKYQNKYRIASARAQWWDYGWNGAYFITICTFKRKHFFGKIVNKKMILSQTGVIADILWHEIPNHAPFVELGDFVVMPNHIHGILILNKPDDVNTNVETKNGGDTDTGTNTDTDTNFDIVETLHATSLHHHHHHHHHHDPRTDPDPSPPDHHQPPKNEKMAEISPKSGSVSAILRSYKSAVTKHANRLQLPNGWQYRFHDHIIRDDAEYQRISDYIINNPANWKDDKFYSA
jgi:putative transposase